MSFYEKLCPGCMNDAGEEKICPHCGFELDSEQTAPYLPYRAMLAGKYVVGQVLEKNSEGVTYLGLNTLTNSCVRIRELLPEKLADRRTGEEKITVASSDKAAFDGVKDSFLNLWHGVKKLAANEHIITVNDVFQANSTAYAVAQADGTSTLGEYLAQKGGSITWEETKSLIFPVMTALHSLHSLSIVHGCVSPDTLFVCEDGSLKLWGFSAESFHMGENSDLRPGYAALEQYSPNGKLTAAADVYAVAATMYKCITGDEPVDALSRSKNDTLTISAERARELPDFVLAAFIGAMQLDASERTADIPTLTDSFTKEAFERQKKRLAFSSAFIDPISDLNPEDESAQASAAPVVVNAPVGAKVVKDMGDSGSQTSTASTVILALSVVFVMLIFFVCLALTGIISFNVGSVGMTARVVEMPDFTNVRKDDAYITQVAERYGFNITLMPEGNADVAQDVIFEQSIAAGTKVERGSTLILTYSKGASTVTLPNFTGMTFTETVYYLGQLNLSYNITERTNNGSQAAGTVATMTPAAGSVVPEGTEITIEVWGESPVNGDIIGSNTGSSVTSSSSILDNVLGSLGDSVSGLSDTIQNFFN